MVRPRAAQQPEVLGRPSPWLATDAGIWEDGRAEAEAGSSGLWSPPRPVRRKEFVVDDWCSSRAGDPGDADGSADEEADLESRPLKSTAGNGSAEHSCKCRDALPCLACVVGGGSGGLHDIPCRERVRHTLLSLRLQKAYVGYCLLCCLLSTAVCSSSLARAAKRKAWDGGALASHEWHPWEQTLEMLVGLVLCAETLANLWLAGREEFFRDCWSVFDAAVVALTLLSWGLLALQNAVLLGEGVLKLDLPLLTLRFVLQPCRVLAAASMTRRVRRMQQSTVDIAFDVQDYVPVAPPSPFGRARCLDVASSPPAG